MRGILALLLVCATALGQTTLSSAPMKCRRCSGASSLDDCRLSIPCPTGEVCYMDEVFTGALTIKYNGGCRPRDICAQSPVVGKRSGAHMICSQCCDTASLPECNTKLCGINSHVSNRSLCYNCNGFDNAAVTDPSQCNTLIACQSEEVCGVETFRSMSSHINNYEFKCLNKRLCTLITRATLPELDYCRRNHDPERCNTVRKRDFSGSKICTACCGDSQCNSVTCDQLTERLYNLWAAGVLDMTTLKQNGSLPATAPISG